MKVKHVLMIAAVLLAMFIVPVAADAQSQTTTVSYSSDATFTIIYPANGVTLDTGSATGEAGIQMTTIAPGSQVKLSISSEGDGFVLKHAFKPTEYTLPYQILADDTALDEGDLIIAADAGVEEAQKKTLSFSVNTENLQAAGNYEDTLTFTAEYVGPTYVRTADELTAALTDENVELIILTDDVVVTQTLQVPAGKEFTLNLNGNDLSYAVSNTGASAIINNKGDLTITGTGTISFVAENPDMGEIPAYATNTIANTGTLTIGEGVTVSNGSEGGASYAVDNHGVFTLDGGTLIGDRCALRIAKYNQDNVQFTMESGLVQAKTPAWIQLPGSNANDAPTITVTINGGTFQSTKESSADNNVLYTYSYGNSHANTVITINGGSFLGGTVSIGSGYKEDAPYLTINGGIFEYDVLKWTDADTSVVVYPATQQNTP